MPRRENEGLERKLGRESVSQGEGERDETIGAAEDKGLPEFIIGKTSKTGEGLCLEGDERENMREEERSSLLSGLGQHGPII